MPLKNLQAFFKVSPGLLSPYTWYPSGGCHILGTYSHKWIRLDSWDSGLCFWEGGDGGFLSLRTTKPSGLEGSPFTFNLSLRVLAFKGSGPKTFDILKIGEVTPHFRVSLYRNCCKARDSESYCLGFTSNSRTQASRHIRFHKALKVSNDFVDLIFGVDSEGEFFCYKDGVSLGPPSLRDGPFHTNFPGKYATQPEGRSGSWKESLGQTLNSFLTQIPPGILNLALSLKPSGTLRSFFLQGDGPVTVGNGPFALKHLLWFNRALEPSSRIF